LNHLIRNARKSEPINCTSLRLAGNLRVRHLVKSSDHFLNESPCAYANQSFSDATGKRLLPMPVELGQLKRLKSLKVFEGVVGYGLAVSLLLDVRLHDVYN
jgi:hypothetical protein